MFYEINEYKEIGTIILKILSRSLSMRWINEWIETIIVNIISCATRSINEWIETIILNI